MNKYIDADKLIAEIERRKDFYHERGNGCDNAIEEELDDLLSFITSLQQDKDVLYLCSQVWWEDRGWMMIPPNVTLKGIESLLERIRHKIKWNEENGIEEQEQPEVDLEKFTDKIKTFQARYKYPEIVSIKGAMAFMARMFYQYPNVARLWYDSLPKATMDNTRKE